MILEARTRINETLLASIIALVGLVVFSAWWDPAPDYFRCPNDYGTEDEYINGMFEWISEELKNNPEMTQEELLNKRAMLFNEHDCEKSKWTDEIFDDPENPVYGDEVVAVVGGYKITP